MIEEVINKLSIGKTTSIRSALSKMDEVGRKLLIVVENQKFYSLLSIGDIQRAIIQNFDLNTPIEKILRKKVKVAFENDNIDLVKEEMKVRRTEFMPVIREDGTIVDVIFWENLFGEKRPRSLKKYDLPVIIMAGGIGTRLRPITNVIPKALIPLGNKTMIEKIIDSFVDIGCKRFYISLNYKADFIEYYLKNANTYNCTFDFFKEEKPLGTAGSLYLIKGKIKETFFISNCDILIDQDYTDIIEYHTNNKNDITIVAAIKTISIPYGILNSTENGLLVDIQEKPEFSYKINTGLYIVEPHIVADIPENTFFNMTDLIEKLKQQKKRIGVFPISEKSWIDVGNWRDYIKYNNIEI